MRILHLIDPAGPGGGACTLRLLAETLSRVDGRHDVLIVGTAGHLDLARRCGLTPLGRVGAALNRPAFARSAIRRVIRHRERTGGRYCLIHAWTTRSGAAATLVTRRHPILVTADAGSLTTGGELRMLARRGVPVLAATPATRTLMLASGYPSDMVTMLPPAVDPASIVMEARRLLRQSWGADETTFVVAHLGDPVPAADGSHAMFAVGRAALTGRDVRIIIHPGAAPVTKRMMILRAGLTDMIVLDDRVAEPWRIVAGLDAACTLHRPRRDEERRSPQLPGPLLWAMAAGVPVIAEEPHAGDWLEEGSTGLVTRTAESNRTAARILDLFDDPAGARRIGAAGRARVARDFAPDAFAQGITATWNAVTGQVGSPRARQRSVPDVVTVSREEKTPSQSA